MFLSLKSDVLFLQGVSLCNTQRLRVGEWVSIASSRARSRRFRDPRNPGRRAQAVMFSYVKRDFSIFNTDPAMHTFHR